jgi:phospholipid/cholesterol/gamma-HCH transport system ATP-binding protein
MKKRVGLARALIMDPKYVLFDEPTTGLDPIMAANINNLIVRTHRRLNITSIVVTHDMVSAFHVGDRIAMIRNGQIVFDGSPREMTQSKNPFLRRFMAGGYKPEQSV